MKKTISFIIVLITILFVMESSIQILIKIVKEAIHHPIVLVVPGTLLFFYVIIWSFLEVFED